MWWFGRRCVGLVGDELVWFGRGCVGLVGDVMVLH